jgi:LAO/AO transport system kinase
MIMLGTIEELLKNDFFSNEKVKQLLPVMEVDILSDKISSYVAAQKLISAYLKEKSAKS